MTEENMEKIGFIKKVLMSIKDFESYIFFAAEDVKKSIIYLLQIMLVISLIVTGVLTYKFSELVGDVKDYIINDLPQLNYENGVVRVESNEPIINEDVNEIIKLLVIDTQQNNEKEEEYLSKLSNYESGIIFLKDKLIIKNSLVGDKAEYKYEEIAKIYNINNFNKDDMVEYINKFDNGSLYFGFYFVTFIAMYIAYTTSSLIDILMLSILAYILSVIMKIKFKASACFNIAVHALTLPVFLNIIYIFVNNFTGFTVKYFDWMYTTISYIYVIIAVLMIKTDFINKQAELMKIVEEQKKVKEELQRQEEKKKKDKEKENEQGDKEDNEENGELPDEPEGTNA